MSNFLPRTKISWRVLLLPGSATLGGCCGWARYGNHVKTRKILQYVDEGGDLKRKKVLISHSIESIISNFPQNVTLKSQLEADQTQHSPLVVPPYMFLIQVKGLTIYPFFLVQKCFLLLQFHSHSTTKASWAYVFNSDLSVYVNEEDRCIKITVNHCSRHLCLSSGQMHQFPIHQCVPMSPI